MEHTTSDHAAGGGGPAWNRYLQSPRAVIQAGLTLVGALLVGFGTVGFALFVLTNPGAEGFAGGLAALFFGLHAMAGFVIASVGLLIPQRSDSGIHFRPRQRVLLTIGAVAPVASVLTVPIGASVLPPVSPSVQSALVWLLVVALLSGPVATIVALGWRIREHRR